MKLTKSQKRRFLGNGHITLLRNPHDLTAPEDAKKHPVTLYEMTYRQWEGEGVPMSVHQGHILICPCDMNFKIRWEKGADGKKRRIRENVGDSFGCKAKRRACAQYRHKLAEKHGARWEAMPLPERIADIWRMHQAGEYLGEHNEGMIYAQEIEEILFGASEFFMPSPDFMSALRELEKRKLIQLSGMILVPYEEHFRFPKQLHSLIAYAIEEPLGWPNGEAGDFFLYKIYDDIAKATGWTCGEDVFGEANIPALAVPDPKDRALTWLARLDTRLKKGEDSDVRAEALHKITLEQWVTWLREIKAELDELAPKKS